LKISFYKSTGNWFFYKLVLYSAFMVFWFWWRKCIFPFRRCISYSPGYYRKTPNVKK